MAKMSNAQQTAILDAHRNFGRIANVAAVTLRAMRRNGHTIAADERNVSRAGLIAAGVDMDALHAEAKDENRNRDLEAQIVAERQYLRLHTAYSFSYINEHAQRNVMGRIYTEALAEYRAARIAAKRTTQRREQVLTAHAGRSLYEGEI